MTLPSLRVNTFAENSHKTQRDVTLMFLVYDAEPIHTSLFPTQPRR